MSKELLQFFDFNKILRLVSAFTQLFKVQSASGLFRYLLLNLFTDE